jgi:hypothetical protein
MVFFSLFGVFYLFFELFRQLLVMLFSIVTSIDQHLTPLSLVIRSQRLFIIHAQDVQETDVTLSARSVLRWVLFFKVSRVKGVPF